MNQILVPVCIVGGMGLLFGILLGVASKVFAVKTDERVPQILEVLPGANCGGCGFAGCNAYANALVTGGVRPNIVPSAVRKLHKRLRIFWVWNRKKRKKW